MTSVSRSLAVCCALLFTAVATASADSILITSGSLVSTGGGVDVSLAGDGFTFDGHGTVGSGIFHPIDACIANCAPGGTVDLLTVFLGLDLPGTATLDGRSFTSVGSITADSSAAVRFTGQLPIPIDYVVGTPVSAPFQFTGSFAYEADPFTLARLDLTGSGTATIVFRQTADTENPERLVPQSIVYAFAAEPAAATPEPASMILLGTGLVGLVGARRRQRRASLPS